MDYVLNSYRKDTKRTLMSTYMTQVTLKQSNQSPATHVFGEAVPDDSPQVAAEPGRKGRVPSK